MIGRRSIIAALGSVTALRRARAETPLRLVWPRGSIVDLAVPVAHDLGAFARYGVEVSIIDGAPNGADLAARLRSGEADAAVGPLLPLLDPMRLGLDARFTTGLGSGGLRLLAEKRSGLRHIEDMRHKRVGVSDLAGPSKLFFSIMMRRKGIDPVGEVAWSVVAEPDQEAALRSRAVDAVAAPDPQGFYLDRALHAIEIATNLSGSYRQRVSDALAVSGGMLRDRREEAASLTRALREGAAWAGRHLREEVGRVAAFAPRLDEADRLAMLQSEALGERPTGSALVNDIAEYVDELRLLGTFPYATKAEPFARRVCEDVLS